jgi:butyrate kinase
MLEIIKELCALSGISGREDAVREYITDKIKERVSFLAPIHVYPGEDEMLAMAENAFAALKGEREILVYK